MHVCATTVAAAIALCCVHKMRATRTYSDDIENAIEKWKRDEEWKSGCAERAKLCLSAGILHSAAATHKNMCVTRIENLWLHYEVEFFLCPRSTSSASTSFAFFLVCFCVFLLQSSQADEQIAEMQLDDGGEFEMKWDQIQITRIRIGE